MKKKLAILLFILVLPLMVTADSDIKDSGIVDHLLESTYSNDETFKFDVSWTGGIKIGELVLQIVNIPGQDNTWEIRGRITDYGLFRFFYPVDDSFVTKVQGRGRLPVYYEVNQKEGSNYRAKRVTEYDQDNGSIVYQKNKDPEESFSVTGSVHNEFSSFFIMRAMEMILGKPFIVPTFADKKRHMVKVEVRRKSYLKKTFLGPVNTLEVSPRMTFKGLYDKSGDTVIWLTDDMYRIPVKINSKILIGSITSTLVSYTNGKYVYPEKVHKKPAAARSGQGNTALGEGD